MTTSASSDPTTETSQSGNPVEGSLGGVRIIEIGDDRGDYGGLLLAGLGAEVIKVEPPEGSPGRHSGPFYQGERDLNRSLFFWAYNRGKRSITLDPSSVADVDLLRRLVASADVVLTTDGAYGMEAYGLDNDSLLAEDPGLVVARLTGFGDDGPWAGHQASDLVHLALGGVVLNCGYDPDPFGRYDLPPVAPQAFHATHIACEQLAYSIVAALCYRMRSGDGQYLSCAIHEAVSKNTEADLMSWVLLRTPFQRQTCRHADPNVSAFWNIVSTKEGRWYMTLGRDPKLLRPFMDRYGLGAEITSEQSAGDVGSRQLPTQELGSGRSTEVVQRLVRRWIYEDVPWKQAQEAGLMWVPLRKPEENAEDEHWLYRGSFADVEHPELGRSLRYPVSKWLASRSHWVAGGRAPELDEDRAAILESPITPREPVRLAPSVAKSIADSPKPESRGVSRHGKPFSLDHIRILDFTWFLASAGATRFMAALGADVIRVEWRDSMEPRRGGAPVGGRAAREAATGPVPSIYPPDLGGEFGAQYNNKNSGKRAISLNVKHPRGLELAKKLAVQCDIVAEGFSPGVMEKWGLGYEDLRAVNPEVIYAKQSGMGSIGKFGRFRSVGPIAASLSGLSEMSGLPEPAPPAGWGYSYLDWFGAYSFALALTTAIYDRDRTGKGQWIDASQVEVGTFLTSLPILDWSAHGQAWQRTGNHSPYRPASPEGLYRCCGDDRWVAITCRNDDEWVALAKVADHSEWLSDDRFRTVDDRIHNRAALDQLVESWTGTRDRYEVMAVLQGVGVAAGVAQDAQDRCERDPQLAHLSWLTEVEATKLGTWPVAGASVKMSATPPHIGGWLDRGAPLYAEHNYEVYDELLGLSAAEVDSLSEEGVI